MFHCPVGVWVIEQRAIILSATVRSPTVEMHEFQLTVFFKFVPKVPTNNIPALVQIMVWCRAGDKP